MSKCRFCKKKGAQFKAGLSTFCDIECAMAFANKSAKKSKITRERAERKEKAEKLALLNQTKKHWMPKAQNAFNLFIRLRDHNLNCISCNRTEEEIRRNYNGTGGMWDAGHYLSCGASHELRFSEDNCHKQCKKCNRELSGNTGQYRKNLIKKIGQHRVDILEGPHEMPKWVWSDYKRVYEYYNNLNKIMKKELASV